MSNDFSDLKLERKECEKCGATWINGQHVWRGTGAQTKDRAQVHHLIHLN